MTQAYLLDYAMQGVFQPVVSEYMQISKDLPQFKESLALLIVTGTFDARFYRAGKGIIQSVDSFKIPRPSYSDREGFFEIRTSHAGVVKSGSVYEENKNALHTDFLHELARHLREIKKQFTPKEIYIFCPGEIKDQVIQRAGLLFSVAPSMVFVGNFFSSHPFELLEKIKERQSIKLVRPIGGNAIDILKKAERARETEGKRRKRK